MPQTYRRTSEYIPRPPPEPHRRSSYYTPPPQLQLPSRYPIDIEDEYEPEVQTARVTDADDSIVLSDLVRTGEASRLRRRGAMRLDHGLPAAARPFSINPPGAATNMTTVNATGSGGAVPGTEGRRQQPSGALSRPTSSQWAMPYSAADEELTFGGGDTWSWTGEEPDIALAGLASEEQGRMGAGQQASSVHDEAEESFVLYCGGEVSDEEWPDEVQQCSYKPASLPWGPLHVPQSPCASSKGTPPRSQTGMQRHSKHRHLHLHDRPLRRTNGCGAVIHVCAFPQKPRGVWVGKEDASSAVVSMDAAYFERSVVARMMKSACGCVREGVGCALCGNPLGTRYMPCQAASEGLFSSNGAAVSRAQSTSSRVLHPSGPNYWQAQREPSPSQQPLSSVSGSSSSTLPTSPTSNPVPWRNGPPSPTSSADLFTPYPRNSTARGTFYVYTFFSTQVSSSPFCVFPPQPKSPVRRHHPEVIVPYNGPRFSATNANSTRATGLNADTTWYGFSTPTTSPRPYSPVFASPLSVSLLPAAPLATATAPVSPDRATLPPLTIPPPSVRQRRDNAVVGVQLDADGVLIDTGRGNRSVEPGSPDKTANEWTVWPGR